MDHDQHDAPLISCVIIFLNGEDYIAEAIESVLKQSYTNWELILVDDGTTDGATGIAQGFAKRFPEKIRYIEHADHANLGMSASRNAGVRAARGEYIALLDADDIWLPARLEKHLDALQRHPEAAMSMSPTLLWSSWNKDALPSTRPWLSADMRTYLGVPNDVVFEPGKLALNYLNSHGAGMPGICSLLIRRDDLLDVGAFDDRFRTLYEDQVMLFKMFLCKRVIALDEVLDKYRQHPASACQTVGIAGDLAARPIFLEWLQTFMIENTITDPDLWRSLRAEMLRFDNPKAWRYLNLPHLVLEKWNVESRRALIWLLTPKFYHRLRRMFGMKPIGWEQATD